MKRRRKNEKVYFRPLLSFKNIFMPCTHVSLCCFFIRSAREITDAVKPADPFYNAELKCCYFLSSSSRYAFVVIFFFCCISRVLLNDATNALERESGLDKSTAYSGARFVTGFNADLMK